MGQLTVGPMSDPFWRQGQSEFVPVTRKTPGLKSFEIPKVRSKFPARYSIKVRLQV